MKCSSVWIDWIGKECNTSLQSCLNRKINPGPCRSRPSGNNRGRICLQAFTCPRSRMGPAVGQTSTATGSRAHWPRCTLMRKPRALISTHHEDAHRARFQAQQPSTAAHKTDGHAFGESPKLVHARHAPGRVADGAALSVGIPDGILRAGGAPGRLAA